MQTIVVEEGRRPEEAAEGMVRHFETKREPVMMLCHVHDYMVAFTVVPKMSVSEIESLIRDLREIEV